jgi:ribonuclease HI
LPQSLTGIYTGPLNGGVAGVLKIYTDGGCEPNPGKGGWGAVIIESDGTIRKVNGRAPERTTSNRMEMTAVLMVLRTLQATTDQVIVHSDSQLLIRTLNRQYGRKMNLDLWRQIDQEVKRFPQISFQWVRGHAGDTFNEMADRLANEAIWSSNDPPAKRPSAIIEQLKREKQRRLGPEIPTPQNEAERDQLIDKYIETKRRYKEMDRRAGMRDGDRLKIEYQRMEMAIIPLIQQEHRHRAFVLVKGVNDYGQHIQVFTEASFQKHQEAVRESEHLQAIRWKNNQHT